MASKTREARKLTHQRKRKIRAAAFIVIGVVVLGLAGYFLVSAFVRPTPPPMRRNGWARTRTSNWCAPPLRAAYILADCAVSAVVASHDRLLALRDSRIARMPAATFHWLMSECRPFSVWLIHQLNARLGHFIALVQSLRLNDTQSEVLVLSLGVREPVLILDAHGSPALRETCAARTMCTTRSPVRFAIATALIGTSSRSGPYSRARTAAN